MSLTQSGIAKALKVPLPIVRGWEQGLYKPKKDRKMFVETKLKGL
jgi:DNA-binding transcriptional regulator YiaG